MTMTVNSQFVFFPVHFLSIWKKRVGNIQTGYNEVMIKNSVITQYDATLYLKEH